MTKEKILVVEDERIIALDIKSSLIALGYSVTGIAASGKQALEKIADISPDLVLMDIMLQGDMDGVETAEIIRNQYHIPVVYLTSHSDEQTWQRAKDSQPFGYIVKPFEEKDLYTTVEIALARGKAEAEIRNALEKEKELNELKSRFVSMVSHEFRTPLTTILFSASLLESYSNRWSEDKKLTHLQRIQVAVKQMTELLDGVLVIGQTDAGKLDFNPQRVNLEKFCHDLIEEIQFLSRSHQIKFINTESLAAHKFYLLDEKLLRHIFTNLLSNAIKYSPEAGEIEFKLDTGEYQVSSTGETPEKIVFQIKDQGIGIPPEDQKRLFETFHRASNVGTISGTGLGLAIVKRSVDLHGGTIDVKSEVGNGTTFTVTIPLTIADKE